MGRLIFLSLLMLSISAGDYSYGGNNPEKHPFVVSGVVLNRGNTDLLRRFVEMLSERAQYPMEVVYVDSYSDLSKILVQQPDAIGWTCGAPFVEDHDKDGQQLIAVPLFNGAPTYHSLILTRSGNASARSLKDFEGKIFAYSDPRSNSGFVAPAYELAKVDIDIKQFFRVLLPARNHEGSIVALLNGLVDVAAVDEYVWEEYKRKHPESSQALREIERYGPFPFTPIVASDGVPKEITSRLQRILIDLSSDAEGKQILSEFALDGFVAKSPGFYDQIRSMLERL